MKLHFMKEDALLYFKGNIEHNIDNYFNINNDWIEEQYQEYNPKGSVFGELKYEVDDIKMDMSFENPSDSDYNNIIILHSALRNLNKTEASDERLWVGLAHNELYDYMRYRFHLECSKNMKSRIARRYFFANGSKRSLVIHALARLWWTGELVYDKNKKNKYEALEYFKKDCDSRALSLFSRNFSANPVVARGVIYAMLELSMMNLKKMNQRELERDVLRYVNLRGGIVLLDYMTEEEIKNSIVDHYCKINNIIKPKIQVKKY